MGVFGAKLSILIRLALFVSFGPSFSSGIIEDIFDLVRISTSFLEDSNQINSNSTNWHWQYSNISDETGHELKWGLWGWGTIDPDFRIYNKLTKKLVSVKKDVHNLSRNGFKNHNQIKFIVHGFRSSASNIWVTNMARALDKDSGSDLNIFAVDWSSWASSLYFRAAKNTRVVGDNIAKYIDFLTKTFQVKLEDIHCIGHSLGAQICGFAGLKVKNQNQGQDQGQGQIGRITGLDPAAPLFDGQEPDERLDPSDAKFVDVIHTNMQGYLFGFGSFEPCGHVDFYPNNGRWSPNCYPIPTSGCNHHNSIEFFIQSIRNYKHGHKCHFVGHKYPFGWFDPYKDYLRGVCVPCGEDGSNCAVMGYKADKFKAQGKFYLSTVNAAPFCAWHYVVKIRLASPPGYDTQLLGKLTINLYGNLGSAIGVDLMPNVNANGSTVAELTFMAQTSDEVGHIKSIKLEWYADGFLNNPINRASCLLEDCNYKIRILQKIEISNMDYNGLRTVGVGNSTNSFHRITLCSAKGREYTEIESGSSAYFLNKC